MCRRRARITVGVEREREVKRTQVKYRKLLKCGVIEREIGESGGEEKSQISL